MESGGGGGNWIEEVEDLVRGGELDRAISFLESTISNLENQFQLKNGGKSPSSIADQLSTALEDLSKLYHAKGFSLKADQTLSRALQIKHAKGGPHIEKGSNSNEFADARDSQGCDQSSLNLQNDGFPPQSSEEDDWEAVADRAPEELLSPQCLPGVSNLSLQDSEEDSKSQHTKRRGRGLFSYKKQGLYSDTQSD